LKLLLLVVCGHCDAKIRRIGKEELPDADNAKKFSRRTGAIIFLKPSGFLYFCASAAKSGIFSS